MTPGGCTNITSAHTEAYGDFGWNIIPACINSPQFFRRAISKSNLLLAVVCFINSIFDAAASLHCSCSFLSNGRDQVADTPKPRL